MDQVADPAQMRGTAPAPVGTTGLTADKAAGIIALGCLAMMIVGRRVFKGAVI